MTIRAEKIKTGTFEQFKDYTLAVIRGERNVDPNEPKIWRYRGCEYVGGLLPCVADRQMGRLSGQCQSG